MKGWTQAQVNRYNQKIAGLNASLSHAKAAPYTCCGAPNVHYLNITSQWEGAADTYCGPATISMILGHWNISRTQQQIHDDLVAMNPPGFDSSGTYREPMRVELNNTDQGNNPYIWELLGPGGSGTAGEGDLWNYTKDDIGNWNTPLAYNIETTSYYHPHPLTPRYPTQDFKHYFAGYGYDTPNMNITVDDPHPASSGAQDTYYYINIWKAIDNFTTGWNGTGGFVPNVALY